MYVDKNINDTIINKNSCLDGGGSVFRNNERAEGSFNEYEGGDGQEG